MKKLIAYSSIAHMGFVTLGLFIALALTRDLNNPAAAARLGMQGAMVQMISHGFVSARCSPASACCTTACTRA